MKKKKKNTVPYRSGKEVVKKYRPTGSLGSKSPGKSLIRRKPPTSVLKEADQPYIVASRIRPIGNSKGVILSNRVIEEAGISPDADLIIQVSDGVILIAEAKSTGIVNTDLSSWDEHYKNAINYGNKPETDVWEGVQNSFDREEWI